MLECTVQMFKHVVHITASELANISGYIYCTNDKKKSWKPYQNNTAVTQNHISQTTTIYSICYHNGRVKWRTKVGCTINGIDTICYLELDSVYTLDNIERNAAYITVGSIK